MQTNIRETRKRRPRRGRLVLKRISFFSKAGKRDGTISMMLILYLSSVRASSKINMYKSCLYPDKKFGPIRLRSLGEFANS